MSGTTNIPPEAGDDTASTQAGRVVAISIADLLSNDRDPDGGTVSFETALNAENGSVSFSEGDPVVLFLPERFFVGTASFDYTKSDGEGGTAPGTVTVTVDPTAVFPDLQVVLAEDTRAVVTTTDLSALGGETVFDQPEHGTVTLDVVGGGPTANIVYTPDPDYNGTDSFTLRYQTIDGSVAVQEVAITVTPENEPAPSGGYVRGTAGADVLDRSGATARVQIAGLEGNDTLRGGSGNDALNGGAGNDVISGGAGADLITGGLGADRMAGGAGADTFLIARGDLGLTNTTDLIVDFGGAGAAGGDVIRLTGFGAGAVLELLGMSGNALAYEVQDAGGANLGRLLVASGGTALAAGDYVFT